MLEVDHLRRALAPYPAWLATFDEADGRGAGLHLGVFVEPYLQYILDGRKTVESRFSVHRAPPVGYVDAGDILLLKSAAGPVVGIARITHVWTYRLSRAAWSEIRERFGPALCLEHEEEFVDARRSSRYASLMRLEDVAEIAPVPVAKKDRRGWVVLRQAGESLWLPGLSAPG